MIDRALIALRSVSGVEGAFVINTNEELLGQDLSPLYTPDLVAGLAHRMTNTYDAIQQFLGVYDDVVLRFHERLIFLRKDKDLLVFVVATPSADVDSLRFGCNLLLVQIKRALAGTPSPIAPLPQRPIQPLGTNRAPLQQRPPARNSPPPPKKKQSTSDGIWG